MRTVVMFIGIALFSPLARAGDFDVVRPLLENKCLRCHGGDEVNAEIDLSKASSRREFVAQPELIGKMVAAIDGNNMPPEDEPQLSDNERRQLMASLKNLLREAVANDAKSLLPMRRLNRLQYNNAVKDLFQLRVDVFPLPEKLMTRQCDYLHGGARSMPEQVRVASYALDPRPGQKDVNPFPKDLRAAHGFDNQANELTLSPLLLDAFLRLNVSIVESPDFNEQNVGVWDEFFAEPDDDKQLCDELQKRLQRFLTLAFRAPVDEATLGRYTAYTLAKMEGGTPFTEAIKKTASAALSSPRFLYRVATPEGGDDQFELASRLSFFLWSSGPDNELLGLAEQGELSHPEVLRRTIDRMLVDPKIERFLDAFPVQWMQLENVFAPTPDPKLNQYFHLDERRPAGVQMVLEPLFLFDTVFVEDRPIAELIQPKFSYRSEFLTTWYKSDLKPKPVDTATIIAENRRNDAKRKELQTTLEARQAELATLRSAVRERTVAARESRGKHKPVDLKPYAAWEFNGDLKESIGSLELKPHGDVRFQDDMVVLSKSYLLSAKLPIDLQEKSLEVWCQVDDLKQRGGGVMGIQGPGDFFDTIVLGERKPMHWISGSNGFSRTTDFPESTPETKKGELLHLVMVYTADGTTTLYRDGQPYGKPYRKGQATFPKDRTSVISVCGTCRRVGTST